MLEFLLNLIFPPKCPVCNERVQNDGEICMECLKKIIKVRYSAKCLPIVEKTITIADYDAGGGKLVKDLKFNNKINRVKSIDYILEKIDRFIPKYPKDIIAVFVPISKKRMEERGFNQVELMFKDWLIKRNISAKDILTREKATKHQYDLTPEEREANVKNAFKATKALNGEKILLLDDILTTGATLTECAKTLKEAGAGKIYALAFAGAGSNDKFNDKRIFLQASEILRSVYGANAEFRPGQYEAILSVLNHRRTLVVQKTGWGKSLVYFISAKLKKGLAIVVSPLLVLMENQKYYAQKLNLRCLIMNGRVRGEDRKRFCKRLQNDCYDVLFTTPETLFGKDLQEVLPNIDIGLFVVDECHCISDWGHDFRLEYSRLNRIIEKLPIGVSVLGTTATANDRVIEDLKKQLGGGVFVLRGSLSRPSLRIQVLKSESDAEKYAWIEKNINKLPGSGIIYCLTKRDCQQLSDFLNERGILTRPYYSSSEMEEANEETERLFSANKIKAVVATIKLGMGYDKPDIGFVIHFQCPLSLVAYYQQIGRAGRQKGMEAYCFMLASDNDQTIQEYFVKNAFPSAKEENEIIEALEKNSVSGLDTEELRRYCNLTDRALYRSLTFLMDQGVICRKNKKYCRSSIPYRFKGDHYRAVLRAKQEEMLEMERFIHTLECYEKFVVRALNDDTAKSCGKCANCMGGDILSGLESATFEEIKSVQERLNRMYIKIPPLRQWPEKVNPFDASENILLPNKTGLALCKYGDMGCGEMVGHDKYHEKAFRDELVEQAAVALCACVNLREYRFITNIPSSRSDKVADFTRRLAAKLGLEYMELLFAENNGKEQKTMLNSVYQYRNAKAKIKIKPGVTSPKKIILVDDMVDSRWTLTVAGRLLTLSGAQSVYPFCLADSSQTEVNL